MMDSLLKRIENNRKAHGRWIALVLCLSMLVSLGTFAGFRKTAVAKVYTREVLDCPYTHEGAEPVAHVHNDDCYDGETLVCALPEIEAHTHTEACFAEQRTLTCTLAENPGHQHGEGCYAAREEMTCGLEENPGHVHNGTCFNDSGVLICTMAEGDGAHTHTADCYALRMELNCEHEDDAANAPEAAAHRHSEDCFTLISVNGEQRKAATCGFTETPVFVSTEDCWTTYEAAIGGHTHTDACYAVSELPVCGLEEHTHTEECYAPAPVPADAEEGSQPEAEQPTEQLTEEPADGGEAETGEQAEPETEKDAGETEAAPGEEAEAIAGPEAETEEKSEDGEPSAETEETASGETASEEEQPEEAASEEELPEEAAGEEAQPEETPEDAAQEIVYADGFLTVEGPDYTVTAAYGPEARLPADTQLLVREIEPGTEEYALYRGQTNDTFREDWRTVEYARFFDISFVSGGQPVQPAVPADVRIILNRAPSEGDESLQTVHFDSDGIKIAADADQP